MRRVVVIAACSAVGSMLAATSAAPAMEVSCQIPADPDQRTYMLGQLEPGEKRPWYLSFKSKATASRWIRLRLAGATPKMDHQRAALSYKTANGGVMVELKVDERKSSLDVYVSYELEVNIDTNLSPEVDLLNTDGPLTNVSCQIVIDR